MSYSRWYDIFGIISSIWLLSCVVITNGSPAAILFLLGLMLCLTWCITHIIMADVF